MNISKLWFVLCAMWWLATLPINAAAGNQPAAFNAFAAGFYCFMLAVHSRWRPL